MRQKKILSEKHVLFEQIDVETTKRSDSRICVPDGPWTVRVYLSIDCQQWPYWDDTVADVHKYILSTV